MDILKADAELARIAERRIGKNLARGSGSDEQDFFEVSAWALKDMLKEAYKLGLEQKKGEEERGEYMRAYKKVACECEAVIEYTKG